MELRVLRYFLTVVQEGNITRAAEVLHITQPTLSRQLTHLEERLGVQLLERGKRHVELTDNGILFYQRAVEIITLADKVEREFAEEQGGVGGTIAIGCTESTAVAMLPNLLKEFSSRYPKVQYDFYNGYGDDIKEKMDKGLVDVALLIEPVEISKYDFIRLSGRDQWGVLIPKSDPLAERVSIHLSDILHCPLIIPKRINIQNEMASWFDEDFNNLHIFSTYNILSNAALLVSQGLGYAICLEGAAHIKEISTLCFIPLEPCRWSGSVLVWRRKQVFNTATSLFIQFMKMMVRLESTKEV